ncbi:MAG TPA: hypothetical protein VGH33_19515 [Isosphaeraceae bacterium]
MFALPTASLLWAQAGASGPPAWLLPTIRWLGVWGDPSYTIDGPFGPVITFIKIVGLFSLLGWIAGWAMGARRDRNVPKAPWLDVVGLVSVLGLLLAVTLGVLQATKRIPSIDLGIGLSLPAIVGLPFAIGLLAWIERALWVTIGRLGKRGDQVVLALIHLALLLGFVVGVLSIWIGYGQVIWTMAIVYGVRLGATYMGLVVLARIVMLVAIEVAGLRPRRLYAIAKLSVVEANRRMWAPWVVLTVFGVILAFTHWFLQPPEQRPAEMGRLYISTLMLLCSLLITVMVAVLSPISLPQDIQSQTIFTVVSKPVRRLELVWGRMLGFMAMVTVLIAIFGGISLLYLYRNVRGTIVETRRQADEVEGRDPLRAAQLREQAEQLRTRMSAREPIKGSLTFIDSRGNPQIKGIDVGQDLSDDIEPRSHIEGATPATAIWSYGVIPDPYDPGALLDRRIPVDRLLRDGTIEYLENQALLLEYGVDAANQALGKASESNRSRVTAELPKITAQAERFRAESQRLQRQAADYETKADAAEKAGKPDEADELRGKAADLHSPPLQLEMTFTIYRTTKGRVGEPVYAEIEVTNPNPRIVQAPWRDVFPIREYYTNKKLVPSSYLVGSNGGLKVEIRCISPTQYLGMGESDLFILKDKGNFGLNFAMGLAGIWLQAMVLTAIGVFAGTFLSWPMALLTTLAFYVAGQVAFSFFRDIAFQSLLGGGPAESLIRLVTHDNQMSDLTPTLSVVVAKTFDALTMPVLTRLAYIVPNFGALDVSNTVAEGFAVTWPTMLGNVLLALAYALPFSIAGYFILKNREVAA